MIEDKDSEVSKLMQPELLSSEKLVELIKARCPTVENVSSSFSKEHLVRLFRQVILPLPQRHYRTNRRGKVLQARRTKAGQKASERGDVDSSSSRPKRSISDDSPDTPSKIRVTDSKTAVKRTSSNEKLSEEPGPKKARTPIKWP